MGVIGVVMAAQVLFGLIAGIALFSARSRAGRGVFVRLAGIIVVMESLFLAFAGSAYFSAAGGHAGLAKWLFAYAVAGLIAIQVFIGVWILARWLTGPRAR